MRSALTVGLALLITSFATPFSAVASDDQELIEKLLREAWGTRPAEKAIADEVIRELDKSGALTRHQGNFAAGLVLIKHKQYREALEAMRQAVMVDDAHVGSRRALVWLLARTNQHEEALGELEKLLTAATSNEEIDALEHNEVIRFGGRMMGFYAGPSDDEVNDTIVDEHARRLLALLDDEELESFQDARDAVLDQYESFVAERQEEDERAAEEAELERERLITELQRKLERFAAERQLIGPRLDETRATASTELEKIRERDEPLADQIDRLDARALRLDGEINLTLRDIAHLELRARTERDPVLRDRFLLEADRLRFHVRRDERDLLDLRREIDVIATQRRRIQAEFAQTEAAYAREISSLEASLTQIDRSMRRAENELTRAQRETRPDSRRSRVIRAHANALTTYEEFPIEAARQALLEALD